MIATPHLTQAHGAEADQLHRDTVPGMAHFSGTGPELTVCCECSWWLPEVDGRRLRRDKGGVLRNRRCRKFSRLMQGQAGKGVPGNMASCRHFDAVDNPPAFIAEPRRRKAKP